ncbi:undecaprenyldiphospho-muramoylpentapeptide beta-N-acetylglucosaminyltransferase [Ferviditalea candida]|uniref:UDP-N-acetylglucosamine--N-acetylmuramyl-(pentapeptide) pyrophosphoryl-undecaprenol N-acetylglucosamine transferase n=1 Tax=Ferviditalea candida TaxID=3108399 RepID=A0ABU5ZDP4_9BACL|nr:undecaprenyldiphospho-muramoylpentapeptide beta-N-acetylglucosaminyltransferase [Paenibacillaceae bacterium T2]
MRVVLTGGGTGGHIYPALAVGDRLRQEDPATELLYIGTNEGLEREIVGKRGIPFEAVRITGFRRKLFSAHNVKTVVRFLRGVARSKKLLREFKPDVVVGTGGFVCGPVVYAAAKLGIPTLIHEQNVIPGLTNRFLSRYVDCIAVSFKGSEAHFKKAAKVVYTGNPSASAALRADPRKGRDSLQLPKISSIVLITGGSRGARALNEAVLDMIPLLHSQKDVDFVWVTGEAYYETYTGKLSEMKVPDFVRVVPYLHNMPEILAATSLVVSRAGASFLAEITAMGIPAILIPSPNVTNNHQQANARWLQKEHAAELILENELNGAKLFKTVEKIISDPIRQEHMSRRSKSLGQPDAAQLVIRELLALQKGKKGI